MGGDMVGRASESVRTFRLPVCLSRALPQVLLTVGSGGFQRMRLRAFKESFLVQAGSNPAYESRPTDQPGR